MSRYQNIETFKDTQKYSRGFRTPSISVFLEAEEPKYKYEDTIISVVNEDCVEVSASLAQEGRVCLLNMMSPHKRGGGVENGAKAQEEHLCRVSNLYDSLMYLNYPLKDEYTCYLSRSVTIFKQLRDNKYKMRSDEFEVDIISVPAYRASKKGLTPDQIQGTLRKIRTLLTAVDNCEILVLSALGCGAYNNPPDVMAKLFKQVLVEEGYQRAFKQVIFAIIDDDNSNNNFAAFSAAFS